MGDLRDKCSVRGRIDENVKQIKVKIILSLMITQVFTFVQIFISSRQLLVIV